MCEGVDYQGLSKRTLYVYIYCMPSAPVYQGLSKRTLYVYIYYMPSTPVYIVSTVYLLCFIINHWLPEVCFIMLTRYINYIFCLFIIVLVSIIPTLEICSMFHSCDLYV